MSVNYDPGILPGDFLHFSYNNGSSKYDIGNRLQNIIEVE